MLIGEDMVARAPDGSHFVGSAITMPQTYENLTKKMGLSEEQTFVLLNKNPKKVLAG